VFDPTSRFLLRKSLFLRLNFFEMAGTKKVSEIKFTVELDETNIPERITWEATDAGNKPQEVNSIMLSLWDHKEQSTLRIDLWTKEMRIDEMDNHFIQSMILLAESYERATNTNFVSTEVKHFCAHLVKLISDKEQEKTKQ
jgi:gliding motility-associated protein GldC